MADSNDLPSANEQTAIEVVVAYRERMALAPSSEINVRLLDTGPADSYSTVLLEETRVTDGEQVPFEFEFEVNQKRLQMLPSLSLRATIHGPDGQLMWTSDTHAPVSADQTRYQLQLVRVQVGQSSTDQQGMGSGKLQDQVWILGSVIKPDGGRVDMQSKQPITLLFDDDGRLSGQVDCNRLSGQYGRLSEEEVEIQPLATTRMACPPPAEGAAYVSLLHGVKRWHVMDDRLVLADGDGRQLHFRSATESDSAQVKSSLAFERLVSFDCKDEDGAESVDLGAGFQEGRVVIVLPKPGNSTHHTALEWQRLELEQVPSASGGRYQNGDWLFWVKGNQAQLDGPGYPEYFCTASGNPSSEQRRILAGKS